MTAVFPSYLDTSALLKLFLKEEGSDRVQRFFQSSTTFATSSLCFGETLGVLKAKHQRGEISREAYFQYCYEFMASVSSGLIMVEDVGITKWEIYADVQALAKENDLDIADAFLVVTLKKGFFSKFAADSKALLITADRTLAKVARDSGLRVWDCLREEAP